MKIGIYGGTFDPPHRGHEAAAISAAKELSLDKLIVVPAFLPPHKKLSALSAKAEDRFNMTGLSMAEIENAEVSDMEIARGGKSYTIDTLEETARKYPGSEIYLLMGTDMFLGLEGWRRAGDILRLSTPCVFTRREGEREEVELFSEKLRDTYGAETVFIDHEAVEISSSELRCMLKVRKGRGCLKDQVYSYIIKNSLYEAKADFEWMREKAYKMLDSKRVPHVKGCEEEAVRLAERWGADIEKAREAAILHDITKKEDHASQLLLCEKYGIMIDTVERTSEKLLHSKTGAYVAKDMFGSDEEVVSAIFWHTTARKDMTLLEKIIYLADYIEPTRDFEGLDELRRLSYEDIDAALYLGLQMSCDELKEKGVKPHVISLEAAQWLVDKKRNK